MIYKHIRALKDFVNKVRGYPIPPSFRLYEQPLLDAVFEMDERVRVLEGVFDERLQKIEDSPKLEDGTPFQDCNCLYLISKRIADGETKNCYWNCERHGNCEFRTTL